MQLKNLNDVLEKIKNSHYISADQDIIDNLFKGREDVLKNIRNNDSYIKLAPLNIAKILKNKLPKYIFGQDHVIEKIVDYFKNDLIEKRGPRAVFLFLGPPATGKTYLAEVMSKVLDGYKFISFDMGQFVREDSGVTLYGIDYKYTSAVPGELTSFVFENPKSIIVFDEIEKAHSKIQHNLLSIFNDGYLKDFCGWIKEDDSYVPFIPERITKNLDYPTKPDISKVNFRETIIIFTSNVGKELYNSKFFWEIVKDDYHKAETMILDALKKETKYENGANQVPAINPAFLSRLSGGEILLFKKLNYESLLNIIKKEFMEYAKLIKVHYNIRIKGLTDEILTVLLLKYAPRIDVRRIKSKITKDFFDIVSDYILNNDLDTVTPREITIKFSEKAKNFFDSELSPLLQKDIVKQMFRENLTLKTDIKLNYKEPVFEYVIDDIHTEKVTQISDYGEDGLIFEVPDVKFSDIAGQKKAIKKLKEIHNLLKNSKNVSEIGINLPKGMILYGPPGTGKTMLAKALANEANLPFIEITATDLLGPDEKKIEKIFSTAREYAPCIIFIDEIDAIGNREKATPAQIFAINKLLSEIDGFDELNDVFIIAATNYLERVDSALKRSGRLEIHIEIKSLDKEARRYFITEKILKHFKTEGEFDIDKLVLYSTGMSGADLDRVKRECGLQMIRENKKHLTQKMLIEWINTVKYGEKIEDIDIEQTLESTAIHEAGHAVISKILQPEVKIEQITITPRKKSLGFVSFDYEENYKNITIEDIRKKLQILLAGRYAQIKKYGKEGIDTGAASDLKQATMLAFTAINIYGMDDKIKNINLESFKLKKIDPYTKKRISVWLDEAEKNVKILIDKYWEEIESLAKQLLEEETIDEKVLLEILRNKKIYEENI